LVETLDCDPAEGVVMVMDPKRSIDVDGVAAEDDMFGEDNDNDGLDTVGRDC
jgi:hypothetical protein